MVARVSNPFVVDKPIIEDECITHGPWGGLNGDKWVYMPQGFIKNITIRHGKVIDCIMFQTDNHMGETQTSCFGFGMSGFQYDSISVQYPNEYLTSISGTSGSYEGSEVVMSLCFRTNRRRYGPFGSNTTGGSCFSYEGRGGMIVGFHGRAGKHIDAIGIYVMPKSLALYRNSIFVDNCRHQLLLTKMLIGMPREAGPWGDFGGKLWDDGVFLNIKQVHVHMKKSLNVICAVQFEYVKKDFTSILSQMHGGLCADTKIEVVNLGGTTEYLTGVSGFYGPIEGYNGMKGITSVAFHTNTKMYGPYGNEDGIGQVYFSSTASPGKVIGFHGRKSEFLSAIGVHMEYFEDEGED